MRQIKSFQVGGKRCRVVWRSLSKENAVGLAYPDQMLVEIDPNWDELETADVLIHEFLHKHPATARIEEDAIREIGTEIMVMLHKAGLICTGEGSCD